MSVSARRAGQHARQTSRRLGRRLILAVAALVALGVAMVALTGFDPRAAVVVDAATVTGVLLLERRLLPRVRRWGRGARGEETVGAILDALHASGWRTIHDVDTGRGNIDHVLVGPAGVLTVETKSHGGRIAVDRIDERMLKQACAQAKHVERISGLNVAPLLVFSRAYLDRPVTRRRGVTVLPARMLAGQLHRRHERLSPDEIAATHRRLTAALC